MMRPLNREVEAQRPGYALYCPELDQFMTRAQMLGQPAQFGHARDAVAWEEILLATMVAGNHKCVVTTVPRFNGWVYEWSHV